MRKKLCVGVVLCCIIIAFSSYLYHSHMEKTSIEAKNTYIRFLDTVMHDPPNAFTNYCHYEDEGLRKEAMATTDYITNYEIERFEQLNGKLWVAKTWIETTDYPDGRYIINFVGIIDGKKYVMTGSYQVPENLIKGCNLEEFTLTGPDIITYDDLITE